MTETDDLRRMLDERGVEWTANDGEYAKETCWTYSCELTAAFTEYNNGTTRFDCDTWCFTPEQAIAATLGDSVATDERHGVAELERRIYDRCLVRVGQLEAENEKLRELVRDTYKSAAPWIDFFESATSWIDLFEDWHAIHKRMHELGIEVDDG